MKNAVLLLGGLLICAGCAQTDRKAELPQEQIAELTTYLRDNGLAPVNYVVNKFADHDVVILGEAHYIKQDELLVQQLIPTVYRAGVEVFAWEFARREDQPLLDSLLALPEWDDALAQRIVFRQFVHWPFREYVDILKAAWQVNQSRPADAPLFRVIGMNCSPDWSILKTPADQDVDSLRRLVWNGCDESDWAEAVLSQVTAGKKVLIHCGMHHAFTHYGQPIVNNGKFIRLVDDRMGQYVYRAIGERAFLVFLHSPWFDRSGYEGGYVNPVDGAIEEVMAALPAGAGPVGFDVAGSPFGSLQAINAVYAYGYDPFTLATFCDGYIFQTPIKKFEPVTVIDGFLKEEDLAYARSQTPNPGYRDFTVESYHTGAREDLAGHKRIWESL